MKRFLLFLLFCATCNASVVVNTMKVTDGLFYVPAGGSSGATIQSVEDGEWFMNPTPDGLRSPPTLIDENPYRFFFNETLTYGVFDPLSLEPLQWLSTNSTVTVLDQTTNAVDADLVGFQSAVFDSTTQNRVTTTAFTGYTVSGDWSRTAILKVTVDAVFAGVFDCNSIQGVPVGQDGISLYVNSGSLGFQIKINGNTSYSAERAYTLNGWHTVQYGVSGNNAFITIDGGTTTGSAMPASYSASAWNSSDTMIGARFNSSLFTDMEIAYLEVADKVYTFNSNYGTQIFDISGNDDHGTLLPVDPTEVTAFWAGTNALYNGTLTNGYSLYEHASTAPIHVEYSTGGSPVTITPQSGYTKTGDSPAVEIHNNAYSYIQQNDNTFTNHTLWYSGGFTTNRGVELYANVNFFEGIVVSGTADTNINDVLTWPYDKEWTPVEYNNMVQWLSDQGSTVSNNVPLKDVGGNYILDVGGNLIFPAP